MLLVGAGGSPVKTADSWTDRSQPASTSPAAEKLHPSVRAGCFQRGNRWNWNASPSAFSPPCNTRRTKPSELNLRLNEALLNLMEQLFAEEAPLAGRLGCERLRSPRGSGL